MDNCDIGTQRNIIEAGRREFLKNGFRGASLRRIVKEAGVTTGAFYGYYKNKEELFDALAGGAARTFLDTFTEAQRTCASLPPGEQPDGMGRISAECMTWMVDYIYEHFDEFKLLLCCAEGTKHERFLHTLVEMEVEATHRFIKVLKGLGRGVPPINRQLEHILVSGLFSAFFEPVLHDMPREKALLYTEELREFYSAGWRKILGL